MKDSARVLAACIAGVTLTLLVAPSALAQITGNLPDSIVCATSGLSDADQNAIAEYVHQLSLGLDSDDAAIFEAARDRLSEPLRRACVSVSFRLRYDMALRPVIQTMLDPSRGERVNANALILAGDLATVNSAQVLLDHLDAPATSTRFEALVGLSRAFKATQRRASGIDSRQFSTAINAIVHRIRVEPEPYVIDAAVRSLITASALDTSEFASTASQALGLLCDAISSRLHSPINEQDLPILRLSFLRAGLAARDALIRGQHLDQPTLIQLAGLGGDLLWFVRHQLASGAYPTIDPEDDEDVSNKKLAKRTVPRQMIAVGEAVVLFASNKLGSAVDPVNLSVTFAKASPESDRTFSQQVGRILGVGGVLTRPPFKIDPKRYQ